jgi:hypothetical protein
MKNDEIRGMGDNEDKSNTNIGVAPANDLIKLAKANNKSEKSILAAPLSARVPSSVSHSKILKRQAIHLIRFCLKSGIADNKNIVKYLEENEIFLTGRTFDRYKSMAERELENDLDANIWLSEKTQSALVCDYKDISDRYDRQLALDDMLTHSLIMQAVDKAIEQGQPPEKYYRNLDVYSIIRLQEASDQTMKNKLELISKGFLVYKIKRHIDHLHNQQKNTSDAGFKDGELDLSSLHSQSDPSYFKPLAQSNCDNNPSQKDEYSQDYLDRYDLVIGMAGKPIKRYLAEIEKKIGKPLSSIWGILPSTQLGTNRESFIQPSATIRL